ncbi:MAG: RDD family protein [Microcoleus sp. PH2017_22_RUC_O_B]|uniref:RDD family protein n=1 Tax=unclassified Microcoleus TaxID=2642155 RepID=UPI001DA94EEB|nr:MULTISPECIES: RDD family protein [unclassified Microcoleus]MCC3527205.1 RDD family protein [Microcoleus sp. PH2017_21_RUC_O_A]MCC3539304.1 RDD family protein [Microcoleus sp. PH2017_22_RUC_O_B]
MSSDLVPLLPKVSLERRAGAFCIDAIAVWIPSLLLGTNPIAQTILFVLLWLIMRVATVRKNQGQSLGRWALDMKIADTRLQRMPGVQELCKREALLGFCAALAFAGVGGLTSTNAGVLLLMLPLAIDCSVAFTDTARFPQAFHDRLGRTIVIGTKRGYSLDIKVRRLLDQVQTNVRR